MMDKLRSGAISTVIMSIYLFYIRPILIESGSENSIWGIGMEIFWMFIFVAIGIILGHVATRKKKVYIEQ